MNPGRKDAKDPDFIGDYERIMYVRFRLIKFALMY